MLPLLVWSHAATKHGDVEKADNIQPAATTEADVIKPIQPAAPIETDTTKLVVAENANSDLMVYSRRPRLQMQEQYPISLTHNQSSTPELGTSNLSNLFSQSQF